MTAHRILIAANFDRKRLGRNFFNTDFKLCNGFTRLGCNVLPFSDRDAAREATVFGSKRAGARRMNAQLVEIAAHYRPHLILFGHTDMTGPEDFARIRRAAPGARLAQFNVDPTNRPRTMAAFTQRAASVDISFITTAEPLALKPLAPRSNSVAFMPNPVDPSVETARTWMKARGELPHDGIFLGNGDCRRVEQITALMAALPEDFRFHASGKIFGTPRLSSTEFLDTLAMAAMSPNIPLDDTIPTPFLYSSNRIAQLLGQGVLALCPVSARQETLYDEGVVSYASRAELAAKMAELTVDDDRRREIARCGWRIAHARTNCARVAKYILETALETPYSEPYEWPAGPIA